MKVRTHMKLRAPAVPLITVDPYFSIWSPDEKLNVTQTVHWTGKSNSIIGTVLVDGVEYSFLGWMVLDALTFHVLGIFYLKPRMHATFAEAYAQIREHAFEEGIVTAEELPGVAQPVTA